MSTFSDVDGTGPAGCASYLRAASGQAGIAAGKRARDALLSLSPDRAVLDAGCGLGDDARRMAAHAGRVVGLDASEALLARAAREPGGAAVEWLVGDVHALPFEDAAFDAVRMERTLQHLADPARAVRELLRVARPGGVVCVCEPDWGTLAVSTPPPAAAEALRAAMLDRVRHPRIGRELAGLLLDAGAAGVEIAAEALVIRDPGEAPLLVEPEDGMYWDAVCADATAGRLIGLMTLVTAVAYT